MLRGAGWMLAFLLCLCVQVQASTRVALVVGNASYRPGYELRNPVADAREVARSLSGLGFTVTLLQDADLATTQRALDSFVPAALRAEAAVIFYAGHGAWVDQRNFVLPVDFLMASYDQIDQEALDVERLEQALSSTHAELQLLMFDACRNNPLETRGAVAISPPAREDARGENMLLTFSTLQGRVALDGDGDHSPFAEGLLLNIADPALDVETLMRSVRDHVREQTSGRQTVHIDSRLARPFYMSAAAGAGQVVALEPPRPVDGQGEIFPHSSTASLSDGELEELDAAALRLARNEIFARRGLIFRDPGLAEHFLQFSWYSPQSDEVEISALERTNVELIRKWEMRDTAPAAGFIFPDSDRRLLTPEELAPLSARQLEIARNEIYARRGRMFRRDDLRAHFSQFDWYNPEFPEVELVYIENRNVALIQAQEARGTAPDTDAILPGVDRQAPLDAPPLAPGGEAVPGGGFIFPDSDSRLLTPAELSPLGARELRIARNEIFARRGRKFATSDLHEHFSRFDWYRPQFDDVELSDIEKRNVDLIRSYE